MRLAYNNCMWSNVISIGKEYQKEIDYILKKLQSTKDVSYATEENEERIWIYLASSCDVAQKIENEMYEMLGVVFLSFLKLRFFLERLPMRNMSQAKCALLSSMLHFDKEFEQNVIAKTLSDCMDYNVDGVFNFRLRSLKEAWSEVAEVAARLLEGSDGEKDVFDIATFIAGSESGRNRIATDGKKAENLTQRRQVEIVRLFDEEEYNLINAVIKEKPCEILLKGHSVSDVMQNTLRKIAKVVEEV